MTSHSEDTNNERPEGTTYGTALAQKMLRALVELDNPIDQMIMVQSTTALALCGTLTNLEALLDGLFPIVEDGDEDQDPEMHGS